MRKTCCLFISTVLVASTFFPMLPIPAQAQAHIEPNLWAGSISTEQVEYPADIADIEQATGLELEQKANCSTTQEKFGRGVRTCEVIFVSEADQNQQEVAQNIVEENESFIIKNEYENKKGFDFTYKKLNACGLGLDARGENKLSFSCIIAIRENNIQLARESFLKD